MTKKGSKSQQRTPIDLLRQLSAKDRKKYRIGERILAMILEDAITSGSIETRGKTPDELGPLFLNYLHSLDLNNRSILLTIDHFDSLLKEAKRLFNSKKHHFSLLLYATWFEHWANSVVRSIAMNKGWSLDELSAIIRETSFKAKITWLFMVLGLPRISSDHKKTVLLIMELRNSFVHYKWRLRDADDNKQDKQIVDLLGKVHLSIKYFKEYERRYVIPYPYKRIMRLLKQGDWPTV